jgi:hypothetical protein
MDLDFFNSPRVGEGLRKTRGNDRGKRGGEFMMKYLPSLC